MKVVLAGRQWLKGQNNDTTNLKLKKVAAVANGKCQRCNSKVIFSLPTGQKYCRACIGVLDLCHYSF